MHTIELGAQYRETQLLNYAGGGYVRPDGVVVPSANVNRNVTVGPANNFSNPNEQVWTAQRMTEFITAAGMQTEGKFFDDGDLSRAGIPDSWLTPSFDAVPAFFDVSNFNHSRVRFSDGLCADSLL